MYRIRRKKKADSATLVYQRFKGTYSHCFEPPFFLFLDEPFFFSDRLLHSRFYISLSLSHVGLVWFPSCSFILFCLQRNDHPLFFSCFFFCSTYIIFSTNLCPFLFCTTGLLPCSLALSLFPPFLGRIASTNVTHPFFPLSRISWAIALFSCSCRCVSARWIWQGLCLAVLIVESKKSMWWFCSDHGCSPASTPVCEMLVICSLVPQYSLRGAFLLYISCPTFHDVICLFTFDGLVFDLTYYNAAFNLWLRTTEFLLNL